MCSDAMYMYKICGMHFVTGRLYTNTHRHNPQVTSYLYSVETGTWPGNKNILAGLTSIAYKISPFELYFAQSITLM